MPRRTPTDVEIIEVLDPNDPTIDWSIAATGPPPVPPRPVRDPSGAGRRRWPWVVGVLAVITTAIGVTVVLRHEPSPPMALGRFVLDDTSLTPYRAEVVAPPAPADAFVLWTGGGRDRPFVSVQAEAPPVTPFVAFDSVLRIAQGARVVSPVDDATTSIVVRKFSNGLQIVARGTGLTDDEFIPLVNSITVGQDQQNALSVEASPGLLRALGLTRAITSRSQAQALYGDVTSEMRYLDAHADEITLRIADDPAGTTPTALEYLGRAPLVSSQGRTLVALSATGENVVRWEQDGHVLTLSAVGDPSTLLALSHHVRGATEKEWNAALRYLRPDVRAGDVATIGRSRLWEAMIQRGERGGRPIYSWRFSLPDAEFTMLAVPLRFDPKVMPFADRVVVDGVTYVFVSVPRSSGVTTASVFYGDHDVKELELHRPFADAPMLVAAWRVDNPMPVRVVVPGAVDS